MVIQSTHGEARSKVAHIYKVIYVKRGHRSVCGPGHASFLEARSSRRAQQCSTAALVPAHTCAFPLQMDPVQKAVISHTFGVPAPLKKKQFISCNICHLRFNSAVSRAGVAPPSPQLCPVVHPMAAALPSPIHIFVFLLLIILCSSAPCCLTPAVGAPAVSSAHAVSICSLGAGCALPVLASQRSDAQVVWVVFFLP